MALCTFSTAFGNCSHRHGNKTCYNPGFIYISPLIRSMASLRFSGTGISIPEFHIFILLQLAPMREQGSFTFRIPYYVLIILVFCTGFLGTILPASIILDILAMLCSVKIILSFREPPQELMCKLY